MITFSNPVVKKVVFLFGILILFVISGSCKNFISKPQEQQLGKVRIVKEWELPKILDEISGIAYLSEHQIACIQDELGTIFIFDISAEKITKKIHFGEEGDYEGIAIVGKTAFVLCSDGSLFEVVNFNAGNGPTNVAVHKTPFPDGNDLEGLTYDEKENRLLLSVKENDKKNRHDYKEIYTFNLQTKSFEKEPVFKLKFPFEKKDMKFRPSEIELGDDGIYVLISKKTALIDYEGEIPKKVYLLDENEFPQPEGLTFGLNGKIFLSSEGSPGKLFQIKLKK